MFPILDDVSVCVCLSVSYCVPFFTSISRSFARRCQAKLSQLGLQPGDDIILMVTDLSPTHHPIHHPIHPYARLSACLPTLSDTQSHTQTITLTHSHSDSLALPPPVHIRIYRSLESLIPLLWIGITYSHNPAALGFSRPLAQSLTCVYYLHCIIRIDISYAWY